MVLAGEIAFVARNPTASAVTRQLAVVVMLRPSRRTLQVLPREGSMVTVRQGSTV